MEKLKKVFLWGIGIIFIITFFIYANQIMAPAIMILIAGIILLPPVNERIIYMLADEGKINRYKLIRNVMVIMFVLVFIVNVPVQYNANNKNEREYFDNIINQNEVDKSVTLTITETNGKYTGERVDGKKQGIGTYEWNNGTVYEGEFADDKLNGQGKLTIPQKGTYEGTFVNGKRNGQGTYTFANGDLYQGNWIDDKISGQGTYTFANGDTYVGEFLNNKFNGQGTYTKGKNKYTGIWKDNKYKKQ